MAISKSFCEQGPTASLAACFASKAARIAAADSRSEPDYVCFVTLAIH